MSEGNPVAGGVGAAGTRSRSVLIVTGTAAAVLTAGLAIQWVKSQPGSAAEKQAAGKATVASTAASRPVEVAAKITRNGRSIQIPLNDVAQMALRRVGGEVLDSMVNRAVIQLACEEAGVTVTQPDVEQEIHRIAKQFNIPTETWLQMLQTERNITPEEYSRDVIWPMLALKKLAGDKVEVTDDDLQRAFIRGYGPKAKVRMIMLDNQRRANEVWQKASASPDDFERLARENSIEPGSRALGGSVPPVARYSGSPEVEKAAFKLREGEISGVIQLGINQYVILKGEGQTEQIVKDINEVKGQLYTDLMEEKVQESVAKLFDELKKTTRVDDYFNGTTTGDVRQVSGQTTPGQNSGVRPASATSASATAASPAAARPTGSRPQSPVRQTAPQTR